MKLLYKNLFWAIASLMVLAILFSLVQETAPKVAQLSLDQLVAKVNAGEVAKITVRGNVLDIELKGGPETAVGASKAVAKKEPESGLSETLKNYGVSAEALQKVALSVEDESGFRFWVGILIPTLLPIIAIAIIFWIIFRQARNGASQAFSFGRSNLRLFTPHKNKVSFKDVAGLKEAKEELMEVVEFLKNPQKFLDIGARIPRGVLLMGPPGTGKTLLARAVAAESNVPFFHMSGSELVEMFVGVGASVSGDTPVLIKDGNGIRLMPISQLVDRYYADGESDIVKSAEGIETLGYKPLETKFWGVRSGEKRYFGGSQWTKIKSVYRHPADKIYKIHYRGGVIKTTGDHSIFVRSHNMVTAKKASELKPGDILVNLPFKVRNVFVPGFGTIHKVKAHNFSESNSQLLTKELDLYDQEYQEQLVKYEFAMANRGVLSQEYIGNLIGVSQSGVQNWQVGNRRPRLFNSNVVRFGTSAKIPITKELMRLLGYYTAEGRTDPYNTKFTFGLHEKELYQDCIDLIKKIFNIESYLQPRPETNSFVINAPSAFISKFFDRHCGTGSHNKHIPEILWQLPKEYFLAYLEGYTKGDGYTTQEGKLSAVSVSKQLIMELAWLCAMHGIQAGVRETRAPAGRIIKNKNRISKPLPETVSWNLIIGKTSHPFIEQTNSPNQFKKPIVQKIEIEDYNGYVYDLCGCENEAFFGGEKPTLLHNSRVRDAFATAKKAAPAILFIDEIDAVGRMRGAGIGGGHDEREQTLNQILVEMDGFERDTALIIIAATNRPDVLDEALLRPGRFDRRVVLDLPDIKDRAEILKLHAKGKPLAQDIDLHKVAVRTPGFSGADLANLINEAAILAARQNKKIVEQIHIYSSIEKVLLGPERKGRAITEKERKTTAYHEAGHALVAASLANSDPVHKVSIVSRGFAGGYTIKLPIEENRLRTRSQFLTDLAVFMGGYVAEQEVFGEMSTGASNDLKQASELSRKLVTQFGMSEKLGPMTFGKTQELIFLGREISTEKNYSESVAAEIDKEVKNFIHRAYEVAKKIIANRRKVLDAIAASLLEKEVLEQEEFNQIIRSFKLKPIAV